MHVKRWRWCSVNVNDRQHTFHISVMPKYVWGVISLNYMSQRFDFIALWLLKTDARSCRHHHCCRCRPRCCQALLRPRWRRGQAPAHVLCVSWHQVYPRTSLKISHPLETHLVELLWHIVREQLTFVRCLAANSRGSLMHITRDTDGKWTTLSYSELLLCFLFLIAAV